MNQISIYPWIFAEHIGPPLLLNAAACGFRLIDRALQAMSSRGASTWVVVALENATVTTGGLPGAAPHRDQADEILDGTRSAGVPMQRLLVTGPTGVPLELSVPRGATQNQIMSAYKAALMRKEVRRGAELAPELSTRMDTADDDRLKQTRSPEELMEEWGDILNEVRGRHDLMDGEGKFVVLRAVRGRAKALTAAGRLDDAIRLWEEATAIRESMNEGNKTELIETISDAATAYIKLGDRESALARHQRALDLAKAADSGVEYTHLTALNKNCGMAALRLKRPAAALPYLQEAYRRCHSTEHPGGPQCRACVVCREHTQNLCICLVDAAKYDEAIPFLEEIVAIQTQVRDVDSLVFNLERLGYCHDMMGSRDRAVEAFKLGLEHTRRLQTGPMDLGAATATVGRALMQADRFEEAVPLLEEAVALLSSALGADHPHIASVQAMAQAARDGVERRRAEGHSVPEGGEAEVVDYARMSVGQLKRLLTSRGVSLAGLLERTDLVRACRDSEEIGEGVE